MMEEKTSTIIQNAQKVLVIQAENPDGDSIGSALALEEVLGDMGKEVSLFCPVEIPKYLRYIAGWDRISREFDFSADIAIIVDSTSSILLKKVLSIDGVPHFMDHHSVIVFDHHKTEGDLPFSTTDFIDEKAVSTGEIIYKIARANDWEINERAVTNLFISIQSDSLGLITENVTAETYEICSQLIKLGAQPARIEAARRELMKKPPEILDYKGRLIERIEYHLDGRLALVHVPFDEIEKYSDKYNPTMLVLDEMRLVIGVDVAIGVKTYPDGKLTGKLRSNIPVSEAIAGFFGGGGHPYAAGFRIYEQYDDFVPELIKATTKALEEHDRENS
ncbi:MAG: DHH family phosphoesterase [Candidatus Nomurabacteria bacterium]|jgi:phosphoesterase RecJ-like protein|nr:DHH family phosphoesterase [Candidatus Nomurabacteria bacterium]